VNSGSIANFQTLFNVITAIMLMHFTDFLVGASQRIIRQDEIRAGTRGGSRLLSTKLLVSPCSPCRKRAAPLRKWESSPEEPEEKHGTAHGVRLSGERIHQDREDRLDSFATGRTTSSSACAHTLETDKYDSQMNLLMQAVPDFERIGDYAPTS
jgi:hypothetical protein